VRTGQAIKGRRKIITATVFRNLEHDFSYDEAARQVVGFIGL